MKKNFIKTIFLLIIITLMTGCSNVLQRVDFKELEEKIKNKESFILLISQESCSHCEDYTPKIKKVLKNNNLEAYNLNITYVSEEDFNKFKEIFEFEGTPTTIFIKDGEEQKNTRLVGNVSEKKLKEALKKEKYLK
ncbi:MAG: thioredoxin family protein [Bacilli bacterium]|nr:thioredoxin family protein [Bacilli bacterium]